MGNLHSVEKAFSRLLYSCQRVRSPRDLDQCDALILPGVGSFDPAMENLASTGLIPSLRQWSANQRPLLGICLGLQLLFDSSEEGRLDGLGLISGHVKRLPDDPIERIPHMGWSPLDVQNPCPILNQTHPKPWVYFVHSYVAIPQQSSALAATTQFGMEPVTAVVWEARVGACQFHPEKSSDDGSQLLRRWVDWLEQGAPVAP